MQLNRKPSLIHTTSLNVSDVMFYVDYIFTLTDLTLHVNKLGESQPEMYELFLPLAVTSSIAFCFVKSSVVSLVL